MKRLCRIAFDLKGFDYRNNRITIRLLPETGVAVDEFFLSKPLRYYVPSSGVIRILLRPNAEFAFPTYYEIELPDGSKFNFVVPEGGSELVEIGELIYASQPVDEVPQTVLDYIISRVETGGTGGGVQPITSAKQSYTHTQSAIAITWSVPHNLGFKPAGVTAYTNTGEQLIGRVVHLSINALELRLNTPQNGLLICS